MGVSTIQLSEKSLKKAKQELESLNKQLQGNIKNLDSTEKSLQGMWTGDAAKAYKAKFKKLEGDMTRMHKMIKEYSDDLIAIANQYESTEQANQAIASALATDVIK